MTSQDKMFDLILELGNPADRRTRGELVDRAMRTALVLMDSDAVVLNPSNPNAKRLVLHAGSAVPAALSMPPEGSEVGRSFAQACETLILADLSDAPRVAGDACPGVEAGPVMFIPLRHRDQAPAYLAAYRRRGRARFTTTEGRMMLLLGAWLSTTLENLRLSTGTEKLTVTDDLTEVYNHRFFNAALRREIRRASRFGQGFSVLLIDVDNEAENDLRGSVLLRELASVLSLQVRSFDVLSRYREDQFMLILPQTSREGAVEVAERMRAAVELHAFTHAHAGAVTVSVGLASFPQDALDMDDLVAATDRALERAQQQGRNCVAMLASKAA